MSADSWRIGHRLLCNRFDDGYWRFAILVAVRCPTAVAVKGAGATERERREYWNGYKVGKVNE